MSHIAITTHSSKRHATPTNSHPPHHTTRGFIFCWNLHFFTFFYICTLACCASAKRLQRQHTHKRHATPVPAHTTPAHSDLLRTACAPTSNHSSGFCVIWVCISSSPSSPLRGRGAAVLPAVGLFPVRRFQLVVAVAVATVVETDSGGNCHAGVGAGADLWRWC
jgi:hypothetical protein